MIVYRGGAFSLVFDSSRLPQVGCVPPPLHQNPSFPLYLKLAGLLSPCVSVLCDGRPREPN